MSPVKHLVRATEHLKVKGKLFLLLAYCLRCIYIVEKKMKAKSKNATNQTRTESIKKILSYFE